MSRTGKSTGTERRLGWPGAEGGCSGMRFLFWVPVPCVPSEEGPCSGEDAQSQLLVGIASRTRPLCDLLSSLHRLRWGGCVLFTQQLRKLRPERWPVKKVALQVRIQIHSGLPQSGFCLLTHGGHIHSRKGSGPGSEISGPKNSSATD